MMNKFKQFQVFKTTKEELGIFFELKFTQRRRDEAKQEFYERSKVDWNRLKMVASVRSGVSKDSTLKYLCCLNVKTKNDTGWVKGTISGKRWIVARLIKIIRGDAVSDGKKDTEPMVRKKPFKYLGTSSLEPDDTLLYTASGFPIYRGRRQPEFDFDRSQSQWDNYKYGKCLKTVIKDEPQCIVINDDDLEILTA